ncbi:MAG: NifB/NifX family molybdenum-iron cluster-binding protein [Armatimonadota bacterium]
MKVAVASSGDTLDAQADPRFGRCACFVVVDPATMEFEAIENTAAMQGSGAGIAAAQIVGNSAADAVIAGNYGPNAHQALSAGGIKTYVAGPGTVRQAVEAFKTGQLEELTGPSVPAHFGIGGAGGTGPGMAPGGGMGAGMGGGMGMGGGGGRGMGRGGGRGMGRGGGRGMGRGGGMGGGMGMGPGMGGGMGMGVQPPQPTAANADELRAQADALKTQLDELQKQIKELEEKGE